MALCMAGTVWTLLSFVFSCPLLSSCVLVFFLCCPCLFLSSVLSFLSFVLCVHMTDAVWTLLFGLCPFCAWSFMLSVSSYRLCCISFPSCVLDFFDG